MSHPDGRDSPPGGDLRRRPAYWILAALTVLGFGLRIWESDVGLPEVYHSDHAQVQHAVDLLSHGTFVNTATYPLTNVFVLAAADTAVYLADSLQADRTWPDWQSFVADLGRPELRHTVARAYAAAVGALLALGVYCLARLRFSRRVALLAAALAAVDPMQVIYSHQARIHVPGSVLLCLASVPVLSLGVRSVTVRSVLIAGCAAGVVAAFFQLGFLLLATAGILLAVHVRPVPRLLGLGALTVGAFFLVVQSADAITGLWVSEESFLWADRPGTLGIPTVTLGWDFAGQFPSFVLTWIAARPACAAGLLACLGLVIARRGQAAGRPARQDLLLYGSYPVLVMLVLGTNYAHPRYHMTASLFLVVLAAAGCMSLRTTWMRTGLAALLVVVPLANSARYDALLDTRDTRIELRGMLDALAGADSRVTVQDSLLGWSRSPPPGVERFPPRGSFSAWSQGTSTPAETLIRGGAEIYIRVSGNTLNDRLTRSDLAALGFSLFGEIASAPIQKMTYLPDAPRHLVPDLWLTSRAGPPIEIWARGATAESRLRRAALEETLSWPGP